MNDLSFSDLPADLQARLAAAGVTDTRVFQAALAAEPELQRELEAFLATNQLAGLMGAFAAVSNSDELAAFWLQVPLELEAPFIAIIKEQIAQNEQDGETEVVDGLRLRLQGVRQLQAEQQDRVTRIQQALTDLADVQNNEQLLELWQSIPLELEDAFLNIVEAHATQVEQTGNAELAAHLQAQFAALRQVQTAQREQPPQSRPAQPVLPDDLKARLAAASVTDEESLQQALAADPELERNLMAVLAEQQMQQLLTDFLAVSDIEALVQFWRQIPLDQEDTFIATVETQIAQAEQHDESGLAEALRQRLDDVRQIRG